MHVAQPLPASAPSSSIAPAAPDAPDAPASFTPEALALTEIDPAAFVAAAARRMSPHESGLLAGIIGRVGDTRAQA